MAIQIPTVKRIDATEDPSAGRINVGTPNIAGAMEQQSNAISAFGENALKTIDRYESAAADTEGLKRSNAYDEWYRRQINGDSQAGTPGLRHIEGDPTPAYNDFDKRAQEKFDELTNDEGLSSKARYAVNQALARKHNQLYDVRLTAYGAQNSVYEHKLTDSAVDLEKQAASDALVYVNPKDLSTLAPFDSSLGRIEQLRIKQALKMGAATESPDGKTLYVDENGNTLRLNMSPVTAKEIKKDLSHAVYDSINTLIKSDRLEPAKVLMDKYSDRIDVVNKGKITEEFNKADLKQKAFTALAGMEDKSFPEQKKLLKQLPDIKVKQEALQLLDANERYKADLQKKDSTDVYNQVSNSVADRMRSSDPFDNPNQLDEAVVKVNGRNVRFADIIQRVSDTKQRKAIYSLVEQPKESDENVKSNLMEMLRNGDFYGMKYPELATAKVGLNKEDSKFIDREWTKQNTETDAQERAKVNYLGSEIYRQWSAQGLIKKDSYGKELPRSVQARNAFDVMIRKKAENFPKNMSPAETSDYIGKEVAQEVIRQANEKRGLIDTILDKIPFLNRPAPATPVEVQPRRTRGQGRAGTTPQEAAPTPVPKTKAISEMSSAEKQQLFEDFKKANNRPPKNAAELIKWNEQK